LPESNPSVPPRSVPVIIRQFNGRLLLGIVTQIDSDRSILRLSKVSLLEVVGLRGELEPIYAVKSKIRGYFEVPIDTIIHWENAPDSLPVD